METVKSLIEGKALIYIDPQNSVFRACFMMASANVGAIVVLDQGKLLGIFTERDLLNRVIVPCKNPESTSIAEVMTRNVVVAQADDSCAKCLELMQKANCRHLPIAEGDRLIGIISMRNLLQHDNVIKDSEIKMMNYLYYYQAPVMED
jgi:CBS domain-containing protein